jgi:L-aspartate oxidase
VHAGGDATGAEIERALVAAVEPAAIEVREGWFALQLVVDGGVAFMAGVHPLADLAPRDVVSRAIHRRMRETGTDHVYLDASMIDDFPDHFPTIWRACQSVGLDPTRELLPVAPAAHYLSGGVVTDLDGATTLPRLWSCGESACSGVHGANRLASNSLLDGLVFGRRVVEAIAAGVSGARDTGAMTGILDIATIEPESDAIPDPTKPDSTQDGDGDPEKLRSAIQRTMSTDCGVVRDAGGLAVAATTLAELGGLAADLAPGVVAGCEVRNLIRTSSAIVVAAATREESRGAHTRADFPETSDGFRGRIVLRGACDPEFVPLPSYALDASS